jgi:hypothetical protein
MTILTQTAFPRLSQAAQETVGRGLHAQLRRQRVCELAGLCHPDMLVLLPDPDIPEVPPDPDICMLPEPAMSME